MSMTLWNDDFFLRPFELSLMPSTGSNKLTKDFMPLMGTDLIETDKDYHVHVDLPGVNAEDLEVTVVDKYLAFGTVQRKLRIPVNADMDRCETMMKNGVLTITMPKKALKEEG
eukprot:gene42209-52427_t